MTSKELREKRQRLHESMLKLRDEAKDTLNVEQWEKMDADFDSLTKQIEIAEKLEAREAEMIAKSQKETPKKVSENEAWRKLILARGDMDKLNADEQASIRAVQSTTDAAGGYTIPTGFSEKLEVAEAYYSNIPAVATVIRTASGNDLDYPNTNDTSNVAYQVSEAGSLETAATAVTFGQQTFKAYKWTSGLIRLSAEIVQDSFFNMANTLSELFGERMGRGLNAAYTTGAGSTTIEGFITGGTDAALSGVAATAISRDNIVDLIHSVDPAYRANPNFRITFNDATMAAIRKLDYGTSDARPLYQPSAIVGQPDMIEGVKVLINNDMADIGASAKSVAVGDFSKYVIRLAGQDRLVILRERFADTDQIGMVLLRRVDAQVLDGGVKFKYLTHAAS